jgi:hypothetical protein
MTLAELEVYHSRPVAPTRRVALGRMTLPTDPPPGFGGILLGGIVAANIGAIDPDLIPDLTVLTTQLESGISIRQPRLRYRFQRDKVGLQRSRHRLVGDEGSLSFEFDDEHGEPTQQILGAVYAAGQLPPRSVQVVMGTVRRAIGWQGAVGPDLIATLAGFAKGASWSAHSLSHPVEWARDLLGLGGTRSDREDVQVAYRRLLMQAHPDHGGQADDAAQRIADLTEARRILLG